MKRLLLFASMIFILTGCSVVSYDRVFPKLTWYWAWDAKAKRAEHAKSQAWADSQKTNSVNTAK